MYKKYHLDLRDYKNVLQLKIYSDNTIENYSIALLKFLEYTDKCRSHLSNNDIDKYMISIKSQSYSLKNQSISAIKLFYRLVLNKKVKTNKLERPRRIKKLPDILSQTEISNVIDSISNLKQKTIIATIYYFGLRRSEVFLRLNDFDKQRKLLHIKISKGNKDRFVPFQNKWVNIANQYAVKYKIKDSLFGSYSYSSMYNILKRALLKCNITKDISLHSLRRSYACHLYESGVKLLTIQKILGHNNYKTTLLYVQVSNKHYIEAENVL